ncbi:hypothetical protein BD560DRAFT_410198 [Blakeslea trispora]|nr:hypothetical protein BD560DRAFT_410198 [Blakeslea trispora]
MFILFLLFFVCITAAPFKQERCSHDLTVQQACDELVQYFGTGPNGVDGDCGLMGNIFYVNHPQSPCSQLETFVEPFSSACEAVTKLLEIDYKTELCSL